jgi:sugar phosphate isomerase/epimerase
MRPFLTRREFLERSAATAAALAIARRTAAARAGMFISLNGADAPGVGPWPEKARLAARIGYGGVDWDLGPAKAAGLEATRALFAELKIEPTITNLPMARPFPFAGDEAGFREALKPLADDAALASAVGCQKMMVVLSPTSALPKDEQRKLVTARLAAVSEVLRTSNIRLGLEFLGPLYMHAPAPPVPPTPPSGAAAAPASGQVQGAPRGGRGQGRGGRGPAGPRIPFIWTLSETVDLAKDSGPNIGAVLDVWHWHHSGSTIADILAAGEQRIVHVHMSDAKPMAPEDVRDNMRVLPGEGSIDLVGFLQALKKIGYEDGLSPEPLGRFPQGTNTEEAAKEAFDATLAVMKKAGVS